MKRLILKIIALCTPVFVSANVVLPSVFSDNMVLQRNAPVKLWGWSQPNEEITVTTSWDNKEYKIKGSNQATWNLTLQTPGAGGPYTVKFKGYNEVTLNNVMLGEVWLCSGQSNMEWTPNAGITGGEAEIAKANYPNIRFFSVPKLTAKYPQDNLPGSWQQCTPETMKHFSAIGYFFAQRLQEDLKGVAIGVINSSWGGTPAEIWFPADYIAKDATLSEAAAKLKPSEWGPIEPGRTWNAMVNPLAGYRIAGTLWYQGESNVGSEVYNKTLGGLFASWRQAWGYDFPFYFVQIAPYNYDGYPDADWGVKVRDAQRRVLNEVPNTAMAVISDVGNLADIHPRDKKPVGIRLANIALSKIYTTNKAVAESPLYKDFSVKGDKLTVHFSNAQGLHFGGKTSTLFEVAGADGTFYPATAKIEKDGVIVSAKAVKTPVKVRYGWKNAAVSDLFNGANLPASSFTSE
jgi:sialate O-acetylesterase